MQLLAKSVLCQYTGMSSIASATINAHLGRTGSWLQMVRMKWKYDHSKLKIAEKGPTMEQEFMKYTLFLWRKWQVC